MKEKKEKKKYGPEAFLLWVVVIGWLAFMILGGGGSGYT